MRSQTAVILALVAFVVLISEMTEAAPQMNTQLDEIVQEDMPALSRHRRQGNVDVTVDRDPRGRSSDRVEVRGQQRVWTSDDNSRRVDVHGSANNKGGRSAGATFSWD